MPVSRQIDAQFLAGTPAAEAQLPSVPQLARELPVNVNAIVRIYERPAAEGLVELRHGAPNQSSSNVFNAALE